jgi:hypothetical protein
VQPKPLHKRKSGNPPWPRPDRLSYKRIGATLSDHPIAIDARSY